MASELRPGSGREQGVHVEAADVSVRQDYLRADRWIYPRLVRV